MKTLKNFSTVNSVTDTSKPLSLSDQPPLPLNPQQLSCYTVTYAENYTEIAGDETTEYFLLCKNTSEDTDAPSSDRDYEICGHYTRTNTRIDGLSFSVYAEREYSFTVTPKKTADIVNSVAVAFIDSKIIDRLPETLKTLSAFPGVSAEYSSFLEADWEDTILDSFNRPVSSQTNWKRIGTASTGTAVYRTSQTTYEYDPNTPSSPCIRSTTTVYTDTHDTPSLTSAKKTTYVSTYAYNEFGKLTRSESWTEGEEVTKGVSVTETEYDEKGNAIRSFSYNTLDSATKFYSEREYAEDGKVTAQLDVTGEHKTSLTYAEGTGTVRTQTLADGGKFSYGYDESGRVTSITQSTAEGEENSTNIKYTLNCPTCLTSGNNLVYYEYDKKRRKRKVSLNGVDTTYTYVGSKYDVVTDVTSPAVTIGGLVFGGEKANVVAALRYNTQSERYTDKHGNTLCTLINNVVQTAYHYNADDTLHTCGDTTTSSVKTYTYSTDKTKRRTNVSISAGMNVSPLTESYVYDEEGTLIGKLINGGTEASGTYSQTYTYHYKDNAAKDLDYISLPGGLNCYPRKDVNGRNTGKELKPVSGKSYGERISYRKVGDHATNMPGAVYYEKDGVVTGNIKYTYDSMGNIVKVQKDGTMSVFYAYDSFIVREKQQPSKSGDSEGIFL